MILIKMTEPKFYVITGGPGVGKTTLLDALERKGLFVVPEDARRVIKEQMQANGEGLPWKDKTLYADLMLEASLNSYREAVNEKGHKTIFFDRSILDTICYRKMEYIPVSEELDKLASSHPYNRKVFILPPWKDIYQTDDERKQTWEEAVYTFEKMKQTYLEYGYEVIEVPKNSIKKRCEFVLYHIR